MRIHSTTYARWVKGGKPPLAPSLSGKLGMCMRSVLSPRESTTLARAVRKAEPSWSRDFGGQQFCLGSAFYTFLETGKSDVYFRHRERSDRRVERALPGFQARMQAWMAEFLGGVVRPRYGFCGAGVHVFPRGAEVATKGGSVHFDVEGLAPVHLESRARTATLVLMLQAAEVGGGLRIFEATYRNAHEPTNGDLATPHRTLAYRAGDALLMESTRLHQIRPFRGSRDRISATLHAVEVDSGVWEAWF